MTINNNTATSTGRDNPFGTQDLTFDNLEDTLELPQATDLIGNEFEAMLAWEQEELGGEANTVFEGEDHDDHIGTELGEFDDRLEDEAIERGQDRLKAEQDSEAFSISDYNLVDDGAIVAIIDGNELTKAEVLAFKNNNDLNQEYNSKFSELQKRFDEEREAIVGSVHNYFSETEAALEEIQRLKGQTVDAGELGQLALQERHWKERKADLDYKSSELHNQLQGQKQKLLKQRHQVLDRQLMTDHPSNWESVKEQAFKYATSKGINMGIFNENPDPALLQLIIKSMDDMASKERSQEAVKNKMNDPRRNTNTSQKSTRRNSLLRADQSKMSKAAEALASGDTANSFAFLED